ncbi:MAG TPA: signal peptidase I [Allosphingosinicella sp.]|nr:signal peptidase I [Allosphingosinicella sp.]
MTDSDRDKAADTPAEGPSEVVAAPVGLEKTENPTAQRAAETPAPVGEEPAAPGEAEAETPAGKAKAPKKKGHWLDDLKAILWLILAVLTFHSCVAKPFYIPSESMMPGLLKGDRLVVSKYPYGWSWVSPSFHIFPQWQGRIWGEMPRRGDIVIVTPPGESSDYIKRVIGLPGDTIQVVDGEVILNGRALTTEPRPPAMIPMDANVTCGDERDIDTQRFRRQVNGRWYCQLPVVREYLPDGRYYDTINTGPSPGDEYPREGPAPVRIPAGHVFLMGDNRDHSADSRFAAGGKTMGLGGPVPWENIGGRAEFITFSLDGSSSYWNPVSWFTALRGGRAGSSLHPASGPPRQGAPRP